MGQPLDAGKAFFYGQFVLAAYNMFLKPQGDPLRPDPQGIPDGWDLGAWIHMSDFVLTLENPEFYGIICRKADAPDWRVIAIRGTEGAMEWFDDAATIPTPFRQVPQAGRVANGFDRIYSSLKVVKRRLPEDRAAAQPEVQQETYAGSFAEQLDQLATSREIARKARISVAETRPKRPMVVTGHSLGAALATLFVMENDSKHKFDITTACTFASPRVGNLEFARAFDQLPIDSWRIVNKQDVVPKLPPHIPLVLEYDHVETACEFDSSGFAGKSLACRHAMETYLHWLDAKCQVRPECRI